MRRTQCKSVFLATFLGVIASVGQSVNADATLEPGNYLVSDQIFYSGGGHAIGIVNYSDERGYFVDSNIGGWNSFEDWEPCCGFGYHYGQWYPGSYGAVMWMQYDGNVVLYDYDAFALWATHTEGNPGAFLRIQDGGTYGNLVVYTSGGTPIWSIF
jgi:hypothetical protein